ncbi:MAG TPA: MerR family transcriptional regulator [Phycisphaerae bacterium]|nr:MerR family transcriptional regulator [Phycisphaerae bacterium]
MGERLTLSELARAAGIAASTVNFYKHHGLLPPALKKGRGANYGAAHVERLRRIGHYRALGYSLAAIRAIFENRVDFLPTEAELAREGVAGGVDEAKVARGEARRAGFADANRETAIIGKVFGRVKLFEGLELHYEVGRYEVFAAEVEQLREAVKAILVVGWE